MSLYALVSGKVEIGVLLVNWFLIREAYLCEFYGDKKNWCVLTRIYQLLYILSKLA